MIANRYYAHTPGKDGTWHDLEEHLKSVAELAANFAAKFNAMELGKLVGLLHDLGKFNNQFQQYLQNCHQNPAQKHRGPDHSSVGAILAAQRYWDGLSFLLAGHHGGLPDPTNLHLRLQEKSQNPNFLQVIAQAGTLKCLPTSLLPPSLTSTLQCDLFLRLLFSALVDADFLDTEVHFNPSQTKLRSHNYNLAAMVDTLDQNLSQFTGKDNHPVNKIRHEILQHCLDAASQKSGFFRLTVPTGGGKTLSGLAFALRHACIFNKHRIIVAIPYTSIIDQTAQVYRDIFGPELVLEHHSAVIFQDNEEDFTASQWRKLAAENWDAPLVVTTTVQLFESLLANRPSACRKLHNLVQSVIILDEVQTLPTGLLTPILEVLQQLVDRYGVTLVLSTATQPALADANSPYLKGLRGHITEIVPNPGRYFQDLKRVTYESPSKPWSWDQVAQEMKQAPQCLAVVNTKSDALALLESLDDPEALHLSTLLCMAHRREVIAEIKRRLNPDNPRPCRVVSTQVVEAGVDLDFPLVLRALGPLDRIVQAAGRCNREGRLSPEQARVIIFRPEEGKMPPGDYRTGSDLADSLLRAGNIDLHATPIFETYFRQLYQAVDTDKKKINELRSRLDFPEVAARFKLIEDDTAPLLVRWPPDDSPVAALLTRLQVAGGFKGGAARSLVRQLQPYLVNVRRRALIGYQQEGLVRELPLGLWEWLGGYHEVRGLVEDRLIPESLVI